MALLSGLVNRVRPTKVADGSNTALRLGRYGEQQVIPVSAGTYALSDEGSYFKATNPTPSTGITASIQTSFLATNGFACLFNGDSAGGKRLYLDYITMWANTAPASATSFQFAVTIDSINRYSSGGSAITPINTNMDDTTSTIATLHTGAITLAAASAARLHSRGVLFAAIPIVNSPFCLNFGSVENFAGNMGGTVATAVTDVCGPVIAGPGHSINLHMWWPANATTAGVWEFEMGWWER